MKHIKIKEKGTKLGYGLLVAIVLTFVFTLGIGESHTKAAEYEFVTMPNFVNEVDEESTDTSKIINVKTNFTIKKWDLYCDGVKVKSETVAYYSNADVEVPADTVGEEKIYTIRTYYGSGTTDYIETAGFTVSKKYIFIEQPSDEEVNDSYTDTSCSVYYNVNFYPKKIEVISEGTEKPIKTYTSGISKYGYIDVPADYANIEGGIKIKKLRVYYSKTGYIESNEFTVIKNCIFLLQPNDKDINETSTETEISVSYQVNFEPKKIEIISGNDIQKRITTNLPNYYNNVPITADYTNIEDGVKEKKLRIYYTTGDYIESNVFTVSKKCEFIEQPFDKEIESDYTDTEISVSYRVNFEPKKIEIISGNDVQKSITTNLSNYYNNVPITADYANVEGGVKEKKLRIYYTTGDYIESNVFTVSKKCEFIEQPFDKEIESDYTDTEISVSYRVNFEPKKIEIISGNDVQKSITTNLSNYYSNVPITADYANIEGGVKEKKLRIYYTANDYIESNVFTVSKKCEFIKQPADAEIEAESTDTEVYVEYKVNFNPVKIELISGGNIQNLDIPMSSSGGIYVTADNLGNVEKKSFRIYYTNTDYIDSNEITVIKLVEASAHKVLLQPENKQIQRTSTETTCNVSYILNFFPEKVELISGENEEIIETHIRYINYSYNEGSFEITADIEGSSEGVKKKKYRFYYNDEEYIDSEEFTVTKECEVILQPESKQIQRTSTETTCNVSYILNFFPEKVELLSGENEEIIETHIRHINYSYNEGSFEITADIEGSSEGIKKKKYRFYYNAEEYIDSEEFTVTKECEVILQPESKQIQRTSIETTCNVSYILNFIPEKVELISGENEDILETHIKYINYSYNEGTFEITADIEGSSEGIKKKKYRFYYNADEYIDSEEFTVTKECEVIVQPESKQIQRTSIETTCNVSYILNFIPEKVELLSGENEEIIETRIKYINYSYNEGTFEITADIESSSDGVKKKKFRFYYNDEEYIDSEEFTVTKKCEFILQPSSKIMQRTSTEPETKLNFEVNFEPTNIELVDVVNDQQIDTLMYPYNYDQRKIYSAPVNVVKDLDDESKILVYRVYYTEDEYVESAPFTVKKLCEILVGPAENYEIDRESTDVYYNVPCIVNFEPVKVEVLSDGEVEKEIFDCNSSSTYNVKADPKDEEEDEETVYSQKKLRLYFDDEEGHFIETAVFTVLKDYVFITHPSSTTIDREDTSTEVYENWATNFYPIRIELFHNDLMIKNYESKYYDSYAEIYYIPCDDGEYIKADPDDAAKDWYIKAYYEGGCVESEKFTVTKHYEFLTQPASVIVDPDTTYTTAKVSWSTSFKPVKVEIVSNNIIIDTITYCYASDNEYITADPETAPEDKYIRAYYTDKDYVDSDVFTVTKHYHDIEYVPYKSATCTEAGNGAYYRCVLEGCDRIFSDAYGKKRLANIPVIEIDPDAHSWSSVEYVWADDNSTVTATRVCEYNAAHKETETVSTVIAVESGLELYVAEFDNPAFYTQKKIKDNVIAIPYGDVNNDGKINSKDVVALRRHLAGGWNVNINEENADVNCDGTVNSQDVTILRRYLAGGWGIELPMVKNESEGTAVAELRFFNDRFEIDSCYWGTISFNFSAEGEEHTINFDFFYEDDYNKSLGVSEDSMGEFAYANNIKILDLSNINGRLVMETVLNQFYFDNLTSQFRNATVVKIASDASSYVPTSGLESYSGKSIVIVNA